MRRCFSFRLPFLLPALFLVLAAATAFGGDSPAFDLAGPKIDVHVQRNGITLPIAQVPNLLPGDRLWIHPDFPESQSTHYVLIVAFLRGATNPPPMDWYRRDLGQRCPRRGRIRRGSGGSAAGDPIPCS